MAAVRFPMFFVVLSLLTGSATSQVSITAYSKDEGLNEKNISKPRIFIVNTGNEPVSNIAYFYYFTADNNRRPVLDDYHTPDESVSLVYFGHNQYAVRYDCPGVTLYPGEVFPDQSGNVVGIHYQNWEPMRKDNDRSFNFSSDFMPNNNITVQCAEVYKMHGREPHCKSKKQVEHNNSKVLVNVDIKVIK